MPLLEFSCPHCGATTEIIRTIETMGDVVECFECGDRMRKVISSGNFVLKGKGWAKDSYGNN